MKKDIISATLIPDKSSAFCRLDAAGEVVERGHLPLTCETELLETLRRSSYGPDCARALHAIGLGTGRVT